ncbi:MAG: CheR family methyltransferase, partial [Steroidobacteraceae bacterium]
LVPQLRAARADGRLTIWSAACATGEEPLSLAMLLDARGLLASTEIVATDLSARALAAAKAGRFGSRSVRRIPDESLAARYLRRDGSHYVVPERLIAAIRWARHNLVAPEEPHLASAYDVILCRNVLIYFADQTVRSVLEQFRAVLGADGVLLVGISESLMRFGSGFFGEEHGGAFVYRQAHAR